MVLLTKHTAHINHLKVSMLHRSSNIYSGNKISGPWAIRRSKRHDIFGLFLTHNKRKFKIDHRVHCLILNTFIRRSSLPVGGSEMMARSSGEDPTVRTKMGICLWTACTAPMVLKNAVDEIAEQHLSQRYNLWLR